MSLNINKIIRSLFHQTKIENRRAADLPSQETLVEQMDVPSLFELWNDIGFPAADKDTQRSFQKVSTRLGLNEVRPSVINQTKRWARVAAIFIIPLLSVLCTLYFFQELQKERMVATIQYFVPDGKREKIILPDESEVWVNGGTLIVYPEKFTSNTREVYLSGEANFKVTHDSQHPFIVKTKSYQVEVLGTQFNISAYPSDRMVVTALQEGSVKIKLPDEENEIKLVPNQQFSYDTETHSHSCEYVNAHLSGNWKEGYLSFQQVPLAVVLRKIEHTYGVFVHVQQQKYKRDLLTVNFNKDESLSTVMTVIQDVIPSLKYSIEGDEIYIW